MKSSERLPWTMKAAIIAVLTVAVIVAYWPIGQNGFIRLDDPDYIVRNKIVQNGLTWAGVKWAFTEFAVANWHPLTWLSHMLDCEVFGHERAGAHHWESVAWHAANSAMLFLLLTSMTGALWRSALVAALFALHPTHVESVAWLAERKDVLSTFFGLLAIAAYVGFARRRGARRYALVMICFALSLLAKPMLVTLPCVLLLLDYWPLQRIGTLKAPWTRAAAGRLILEKIPLLALSLASSAVTFMAQRSGGAVVTHDQLSMAKRLANAVFSYARYMAKTVWPADLALQYPHLLDWPTEKIAMSAIILLLITLVSVITWKRWPFLIVGWLWFLGTMVPVIGVLQVGGQSMADRYTYVPTIGLFIMVSWGLTAMVRGSTSVKIAAGVSVAVIANLGWATYARVQVWRDTETVFRDSIAKAGENWYIEFLLGAELRDKAQARRELPVESLPYFEKFARVRPQDAYAQAQHGEILAVLGRYRDAAQAYARALKVDPNLAHTDSLNNYACILATSTDDRLRDGPLAVKLATRACELTEWKNAGFQFTLAAAQAENGQFELAVKTAGQALSLARAGGQPALAESIQQRIEQFKQGKPSRVIIVEQDSADQAATTASGSSQPHSP